MGFNVPVVVHFMWLLCFYEIKKVTADPIRLSTDLVHDRYFIKTFKTIIPPSVTGHKVGGRF